MVVLRDQWQQYLRIPSLFALFIKKTLSIKNSVTLFNQTVVKVWEGLGQSNLHFNQTYFSFFPLRQSFWFFQNQITEIFFIEKHMIWPLHHLISSFGSIFEYCIRHMQKRHTDRCDQGCWWASLSLSSSSLLIFSFTIVKFN